MPPKEPEFRYVAANVRRLRLRRGWSQEALAEAAGMDVTALARLERAEVSLWLHTLLRVARALGVQPGALLKPAKFSRQKPGRPSLK